MLYESHVISIICDFLKSQGFKIEQQLTENERGYDIIAASKTGLKIYVEAKGETSSKSHTRRFGKPFTRNQCRSHVAEALLRTAQIRQEKDNNVQIGIALPDTPIHR